MNSIYLGKAPSSGKDLPLLSIKISFSTPLYSKTIEGQRRYTVYSYKLRHLAIESI